METVNQTLNKTCTTEDLTDGGNILEAWLLLTLDPFLLHWKWRRPDISFFSLYDLSQLLQSGELVLTRVFQIFKSKILLS